MLSGCSAVPADEALDDVGALDPGGHIDLLARARTAEVVVPAIRGCASIMDSVFRDRDADGQADATGSQ